MAKRRTKKQKVEAKVSYRLPSMNEIQTQSGVKNKTASIRSISPSILMYDIDLLKRDLLKTVLLSLVILGLELILYYYLK